MANKSKAQEQDALDEKYKSSMQENTKKETKKKEKLEKNTSDKKQKNKKTKGNAIVSFFRDCKNEIKKIIWPTPKAVFKNMGIVLIVVIIIGLFVFALDATLINLLGTFMSVSK